MVWYSHLLQNFPQFIVIHTVKGSALFGGEKKLDCTLLYEHSITLLVLTFVMDFRLFLVNGASVNTVAGASYEFISRKTLKHEIGGDRLSLL